MILHFTDPSSSNKWLSGVGLFRTAAVGSGVFTRHLTGLHSGTLLLGVFCFLLIKDVDDILGKPWPTDPRIFVTDVYSIENYLVSRDSFIRFCQEAVRLGDVGFQLHSPLLDRFDEQLSRFQRLIIPLMAWVVTMRREGQRPILTNINLGEFFEIDVECSVRLRPCKGVEYLNRVAGVRWPRDYWRRVLSTSRELNRMPPKRVIRGKFEAWFFVEFWKKSIRKIQELAREGNARATIRLQLEHANFIVVLAGRMNVPRSLELFLVQNLRVPATPEASVPVEAAVVGGWAAKVLRSIRRFFSG